jgi:uncharacterized repeat protein (TIGR03803 family)
MRRQNQDHSRVGTARTGKLLVMLTMALTLTAELAAASSLEILHKFKSGDGADPLTSLTLDGAGNLYGTTPRGGGGNCAPPCGTVFQLVANSDGTWTENLLHQFSGGSDGENPLAGVIFDAAGNLYGTTSAGGFNDPCCGTVFELAHNSDGSWTKSVLYNFKGGSDGDMPMSNLIFDGAGNLYGTTDIGGSGGRGTVFQLVPHSNGRWTESVLYNFCSVQNCSDGSFPIAGLTSDAAGNLYGTTSMGGIDLNCCGTVFKLTHKSDGSWTMSILYSFKGGSDGGAPDSNLVFDGAGNLYGATGGGGNNNHGTVVQLIPHSNGRWTESVLHRFCTLMNCVDGDIPTALTFDAAGNLYAATAYGGSVDDGIVFRLAPRPREGWAFRAIYTFKGKPGIQPRGGLVFDKTGKGYGTASLCAAKKCQGTVFELTP